MHALFYSFFWKHSFSYFFIYIKIISLILSRKQRKTSKESSWKESKQQYGCERYKNLSENEKNKLVEYRKNYYRMKKSIYCNYKKAFSSGKSGRNFQFSGFVKCLRKYKENSVSWNIKGFSGISVSRNVRKAFFW